MDIKTKYNIGDNVEFNGLDIENNVIKARVVFIKVLINGYGKEISYNVTEESGYAWTIDEKDILTK